jgi:hypothetical protein
VRILAPHSGEHMGPCGWHITIRPATEQLLCTTDAERRRFARTVHRLGRDRGLFVFNVADTHGHLGVVCDRATAGRLAHDLEAALGAALGLAGGFAPARLSPLRDIWHRENAFFYILRQQAHHGLAADPFHDGSALPDLLGLRVGAAWLPARVRALLPRVDRDRLLAVLGHAALEPGASAAGLAAAATAAGCDDLHRKSPTAMAAKVAAVAVGRGLGLTTGPVAMLLGLDPRTVRRLARLPADPDLVRAIMLQLGLRAIAAPSAPSFVAERRHVYGSAA